MAYSTLFVNFRKFVASPGVLALLLLAPTGCEHAPAATTDQPEEKPVTVSTSEVTAVSSPVLLRLTGSLKGAKEADLAANVAGKVVSTAVERGQRVKAGDLLARVDVQAAQLALAEARVSVESSKTLELINKNDCERYEKLRSSGVVSDLEYDQVTAKCRTSPLNVEAAEARQRLLAKNVGDGMIRSPFSGVVTERYVTEGEYVQASSRVVSLAQVDELRLVFSVPEKNYPDVKLGADISLAVAAYGETLFSGKVVHISGAVRDTRDVVVEAAVGNPEGKLLPGMFADIELKTGEQMLPSVPETATFVQNGKLNVLVASGGLLVQRVVQPSPKVGNRIPILRGVSLGEKVVTTYDPKLSNGQGVN
jgi:membrane fusion protein (multidrug efflux system)